MRRNAHLLLAILVAPCLPLAGCGGGGETAGVVDATTAADVVAGDDAPGDAGTDAAPMVDAPSPDPGRTDSGPTPPPAVSCAFGAYATSVFDAPFPSDALRGADGAVDLSLFPRRGELGLFDRYLEFIEAEKLPWPVSVAAAFPLTGAIDPAMLPAPAATGEDGAGVMLVNITEGSPHEGERIPLVFRWWSAEPGVILPGNVLMMHPVWGMTLREDSTYAFVLTTGLAVDGSRTLTASEGCLAALRGADGAPAEHVRALAPLRAYVERVAPTWGDAIACATVVTTGSPTGEMARLRDFVAALDPATTPDLPMTFDDLQRADRTTFYDRFDGTYKTPNFQSGEPPFLSEGGAIVFDDGGEPVIQHAETIDVAIAVPTVGEMPADGWPVVIHSPGTSGDLLSHFSGSVGGANGNPVGRLATHGIASVGINPPLTADRCQVSGCNNTELITFNLFNPAAPRATFRQQALDSAFLAAILRRANEAGGRGPVLDLPDHGEVRFDADRVYYFGHSQGGLTGALLAAVEPAIDGWLLSGAGAGLPVTILERKDLTDFEFLARSQLQIPRCTEALAARERCELDPMHPVMTLFATIVDPVDPVAFARHWLAGTYTGRAPNMIVIQGLIDEATPPATSDALAVAGRLPIAGRVERPIPGLELLGLDPLALPTSNNVTGPDGQPASAGFFQYPMDHFAVFYPSSPVVPTYQSFFRSLADGGPALLTTRGP